MNKWRLALPLITLPMLLLTACVTINIYFPAAAAEKAADKIIDDVWQLKQGKDKTPDSPDTTTPAK